VYALCWFLRVVVCLISSFHRPHSNTALRIECRRNMVRPFQAPWRNVAQQAPDEEIVPIELGGVSHIPLASFPVSAGRWLRAACTGPCVTMHPWLARARPTCNKANGTTVPDSESERDSMTAQTVRRVSAR